MMVNCVEGLVSPVHHRFPGSCFIMCIIWFSPFGNEKVLVPLREQGQKIHFLRYHLVCR